MQSCQTIDPSSSVLLMLMRLSTVSQRELSLLYREILGMETETFYMQSRCSSPELWSLLKTDSMFRSCMYCMTSRCSRCIYTRHRGNWRQGDSFSILLMDFPEACGQPSLIRKICNILQVLFAALGSNPHLGISLKSLAPLLLPRCN